MIMYFIMLTAGATLHPAGITEIQTADQAAQALRPVAGSAAALLFAAGIIGTGMLGVPVLAGSAAYAVAEAAAWRRGMDEHPRSAANFYGVIVAAMVIGMAQLREARRDQAARLGRGRERTAGAAAHRHHSRRVQQPASDGRSPKRLGAQRRRWNRGAGDGRRRDCIGCELVLEPTGLGRGDQLLDGSGEGGAHRARGREPVGRICGE